MKNQTILITILSFLLLFSCKQEETKEEETPAFDSTILQGTWKMSSMQPEDTTAMVTPEYTQIKIFGDLHFAVINMGKDHSFNMTLGGVYEITEEGFTEKIFYYSGDSTFSGSEINFTYEADENTYHQSGVISQDSADDMIIEESYKRVEPAMADSKDNPLVGMWRLEKGAYDKMENAEAPPEGFATYKIITPGHFYVVQFKNTGKCESLVFGTHKMEGEKYMETIITTSLDSALMGTSVAYDYEVGDSTFSQNGSLIYQGEDYKIEEYFTRVE